MKKKIKRIPLDYLNDKVEFSKISPMISPEICADLVAILHAIYPDLPTRIQEQNNEMDLLIHLKKYSNGEFYTRIDHIIIDSDS